MLANIIRNVIAVMIVIAFSQQPAASNLSPGKGWEIISSDNSTVTFRFTPLLSHIDTIYTDNGYTVLLPVFQNVAPTGNSFGSPYRYQAIGNLLVPGPGSFTLVSANYATDRQTFEEMQAPVPDIVRYQDVETERFIPNTGDYDSYTNPAPATLEYAGKARDFHLARLTVNPVRITNNGTGFEIVSSITVKVRIDNAPITYSGANELQYLPPILNYEQSQSWNWKQLNYDKKQKNILKIQMDGEEQWVKIKIDKEGIYRITADMLSSAGESIPADKINTIQVFGRGGLNLPERQTKALDNKFIDQPIVVNTNSDGSLKEILFYALGAKGLTLDANNRLSHYINDYTDNHYYYLRWGKEEGNRFEETAEQVGEIVNRPETYIEMIWEDGEKVNAFTTGSGRYWFGHSIFPKTYTNMLHNLDRDFEIEYRFSMGHRSSSTGVFTMTENKEKLGTLVTSEAGGTYEHASRSEARFTEDASIVASDNRSIITIEYANSKDPVGSTPMFDWYEIHYPRTFVPIDGSIGFYTDPELEAGTEYSINNFGSGQLYGFDVTDPDHPKGLKNLATSGGMFRFQVNHTLDARRRFFISKNTIKPTLSKVIISGLRNNDFNTDVILITHKSLYDYGEWFKEHREEYSDLTVSVVTTEQIFNEFSYGAPDPTAIRDYLAHAYERWDHKPFYVVLFGDAHFDYKNTSTQIINYVPTYETADYSTTYNEMTSYCTDDYFGKVSGDDNQADLAVGRITVDSPTSAYYYMKKLIHYETGSDIGTWRTRMMMIADDSFSGNNDTDGTRHSGQSEDVSKHNIPDYMQQKKCYLAEYPTENVAGGRRKPGAQEEFVSTVNNSGALIVNWIGHGNPRVLAHEEIFERSTTTPMMENYDKLFFMAATTCSFGHFDTPDTRSGAEELLLAHYGGAIGLMATTRVVHSSNSIPKAFYNQLFEKDQNTGKFPTLGKATWGLKQSYCSPGSDDKYGLLGDPTLNLLLPDQTIGFDAINDIPLDDTTLVKLKALSKIKVDGSIYKLDGQTVDNNFNGTVVITMLDSDEEITVIDDFDQCKHNILKQGGALSRGSFRVTDGHFSAEFTIPMDISYSDGKCRMFAYAFTADTINQAMGFSDKYRMDGIDEGSGNDTEGPEISIFMDSRLFLPGDIVCNEPVLLVDIFDENGLNTTGLGVGHKIEAWIDGSSMPIDLTDKFETSLTDSRWGAIETTMFDLEPGEHTIKIRAWDVYNNYSTGQTNFLIAENHLYIYDCYNYPNPFSFTTTLRLKHNASVPAKLLVWIYSADGTLVREIESRVSMPHYTEILWDGLDNQGKRPANGAYFYKMKLIDENGLTRRYFGEMIINRE